MSKFDAQNSRLQGIEPSLLPLSPLIILFPHPVVPHHSPLRRDASLEVLAQLTGIHGICAPVDIEKLGTRPCLGYGLSGSNEGMGNANHGVPWLNARTYKGKAKGVCAAVDTDAILRIAILGELSFKSFYFRSSDKAGCFKRPLAYL